MSDYLKTAEVNARLDTAVSAHGHAGGRTFATRHSWGTGHEGQQAGYVKIAATMPASPAQRWSVVVLGGMHAREMAPPDALVSFVERLLAAYAGRTGVSYPAFTSTDGVVFDAFDVTAAEVDAVVERLNLVVAPLVNADGRDFVLSPPPGASPAVRKLHKEWRKNRRPQPVGLSDPRTAGVDLNRNFDIVFDFARHYDTSVANVVTSANPVDDSYCGPGAASEPETANLVALFDREAVSWLLDVHMYGRTVMYSWGTERNQTTDPTQSFLNPAWDHKRDGVDFRAYDEFIPAPQETAARDVATNMVAAIAARAGGSVPAAVRRSTYRPIPSSELYVTTGAVDDYCFSRWFTSADAGRPLRPVVALTMEAGGRPGRAPDTDGEFWPDHTTQYPKIEREIHAAVWSFLTQAATTPVAGRVAPPLPGPATGSGRLCLVATTLYEDAAHPSVAFLRDVRDRQLHATGWGRTFARRLDAAYDRTAPPLAVWLMVHPRLAWLARRLVLAPFVVALRSIASATARLPRARSLALSAALALFAAPAIAVVRAVHRLRPQPRR
jgi:murein tripeptide amidase MpaA